MLAWPSCAVYLFTYLWPGLVYLGHYVADVYDVATSRWLTFDDRSGTVTTEERVRKSRVSTGYIFFYQAKYVCHLALPVLVSLPVFVITFIPVYCVIILPFRCWHKNSWHINSLGLQALIIYFCRLLPIISHCSVGQTIHRLSVVLHLWPYCLECSTRLP